MTTDEALDHAESSMAGRAAYADVIIRVDALRHLVEYVKAVRPVPTAAPDDFNRWQDAIDEALSHRTAD